VLPTLPGLTLLDVSLNGLTSVGFQGFCEVLGKETSSSTLKGVIVLKLASEIKIIVRIPF